MTYTKIPYCKIYLIFFSALTDGAFKANYNVAAKLFRLFIW